MDGSLSRGTSTIPAQAGQPVHLPGSLSEASLIRSGDDLIVVGAGGERIVVHGYFLLSPLPSLTGASGEVFDGDLVARLAGPMAPGQYAQAGDPANAASTVVGRVDKAEGEVSVQHADGTHGHLKAGDPLYEGDLIRTAPGSSVGVVLLDGTAVSLGELARLVLSDVAYNSDSHQGDMMLDLVAGPLSFVSGEIAKTGPDAFHIHTPTTTIGIRGTAGGIIVSPMGGTSVVLIPESGGRSGEISVGGMVLNQPMQSLVVLSATQPPSPPVVLTPNQVAQQYGGALAALPGAASSIDPAVGQAIQQQQLQQQQPQSGGTTGGGATLSPAPPPAPPAPEPPAAPPPVVVIAAPPPPPPPPPVIVVVPVPPVETVIRTVTPPTTTTTTPPTTPTLPTMTRWQLEAMAQSGSDLVVTYKTLAGVETVVTLTGAFASSSVASTTLSASSGETMKLVGAVGGVAPATLTGTSGNDIIVGTLGSATLASGGGSDLFYVADLGSGHHQTVIGSLRDTDGDGYPGGGEVDFSGLATPITMAYAPSAEVIHTPTAAPLGVIVVQLSRYSLWTLNNSVWSIPTADQDATPSVLLTGLTHAELIPISQFGAVIAGLGSDGTLTFTAFDARGDSLAAGTPVSVSLGDAEIDAVSYCTLPGTPFFGVVINGEVSTQISIYDPSSGTPLNTLSVSHAAGDGAAQVVGTSTGGLFVAWTTDSDGIDYKFYPSAMSSSFVSGTLQVSGTLADATLVTAQALDDGGAVIAWVTTDSGSDSLHLAILPQAGGTPITNTLADLACSGSMDSLQSLTLTNGDVVVSWIDGTTLKAVLIDPANGEMIGSPHVVMSGLSIDLGYALVPTSGASFLVQSADSDGTAIELTTVMCNADRTLEPGDTADDTLVAQVSGANDISCGVHYSADGILSVEVRDGSGTLIGSAISLAEIPLPDNVAVCSLGSLGFSVQWIDSNDALHVKVINDTGSVTGTYDRTNVIASPDTLHASAMSDGSSQLIVSYSYNGAVTLAPFTLTESQSEVTISPLLQTGPVANCDDYTALGVGEGGILLFWISGESLNYQYYTYQFETGAYQPAASQSFPLTNSEQTRPYAVQTLSDGRIQAAWIGGTDETGSLSLIVKIFDADGSLSDSQPAPTLLYQVAGSNLSVSNLEIATLANGMTLLTWIECITNEGVPTTTYSLMAVQFDSSGLRGQIETLHSLTDSNSSYSLISLADGSIQINLHDDNEDTSLVFSPTTDPSWTSEPDQDATVTTEYSDIGLITLTTGVMCSVFMIDGVAMAQRLDATGDALGSPVVLAEGLPTTDDAVSLTQLGTNGFAMQWLDSSGHLHLVPVTLLSSGIHAGTTTTITDVSFAAAALQTTTLYNGQGVATGLLALTSDSSGDGTHVTLVPVSLSSGTFSEGSSLSFNTYGGSSEFTPLGLTNGNILVAWISSNKTIVYQVYNASTSTWSDAQGLSGENTAEGDGTLVLTALSGGRAMISWVACRVTDWGEGGTITEYEISLTTIDADGSSNSISHLNSYIEDEISNLQTTQLVDGNLLVTWVEGSGTVRGRLVTSSGHLLGNELNFLPVTGSVSNADYSIVAQSDGSFVVEWGDSTGAIHTARFDSAGSPVEIATSGSGATYTLFGLDTIVGTSFDDTLYGAANQTLIGGAGNDTFHGVAGTMVSYAYDPAGVTVNLTSNMGYDGSSTSVFDYDTLIGISVVKGSRFADTLRAGNNLDTVYTLIGGGGADTLYGSEGDVTFVVDPTQGATVFGGNHESTLILDYSDESSVPSTINLSMLADGHYARIDNIALYSSDGPRVIEVNEESLASFYDQNSRNGEDYTIGIVGSSSNTVSLTGGYWTDIINYGDDSGSSSLIDSNDLGISIRDGITLSFGAATTFEGGGSFDPGGDLIIAGTIDVVGSYYYDANIPDYVQKVHGALNIEGDVTLTGSSVLSLDWGVDASDSSGTSDSLSVCGDLTLGGILDLTSDGTWTSGETLDLIYADSVSGHFSEINGLCGASDTWLLDPVFSAHGVSATLHDSDVGTAVYDPDLDGYYVTGQYLLGTTSNHSSTLDLSVDHGVAIARDESAAHAQNDTIRVDLTVQSSTASQGLSVDFIDGGLGTNTLDLYGDGYTVDLTSNNLSTIEHIQKITLEGNTTLKIDAAHVLAMLGGETNPLTNSSNTLLIGGTQGSNSVDMTGWTAVQGSTITVDHVSYQVYTDTNHTANIAVNT